MNKSKVAVNDAALMLVTHRQESCTRNFYKSTCTRNLTVCRVFLYKFFLVQESCIKQNRTLFDARKLQTRHQNRDVIGRLVCRLL